MKATTATTMIVLFLGLLFDTCKEEEPIIASPTVITESITSYTSSIAEVGGIVTSDGGAPVTDRGVYFGTSENPESTGSTVKIGMGSGAFSEVVIDLTANTKYYVKAYAINKIGKAYGAVQSFTTSQTLPHVTTHEVTRVGDISAIIRGTVEEWGGTGVTESGVYVSLSSSSENSGTKYPIGSGNTPFSKDITGLKENTRYFYRAYAINSMGRALGSELTFRTAGGKAGCYGCETGKFTDNRDMKEYKWVRIGDQYWMSENLAWLPAVNPPTQSSTTNPLYYVSGYTGTDVSASKATDNYKIYGVLYNWPAAMNGSSGSTAEPSGVQGSCPVGWHLPSNEEWDRLAYYLGGSDVAGYKLKDNAAWGNEANGDNSSGFHGLPAGSTVFDDFIGTGGNSGICYFWSSTAYQWDSNWAWFKRLDASDSLLYSGQFSNDPGFSVRCLKD